MEQLSTKSQNRRRILGLAALMVPLFLILAASIWLAARTWVATDAAVPGFAYVYMGLGVVFSLIVGCGLMALVFYSSRKDYDR